MKRADLFFTAVLVPLDFLTLLAAATTAYALRFSPWVRDLRPVVFDLDFAEYLNIAGLLAITWMIIFAFAGLYRTRPHRLATEFVRIILACSTGIAVILAIAFFSRELFDSRFILLAGWILAVVFLFIERLLIRLLQRSLRKFGIGTRQVFIVGKTKSGNALKSFFGRFPHLGFVCIGQAAAFTPELQTKLKTWQRDGKVDMLLLANPDVDNKTVAQMKSFSDNHHLRFLYSADVFPGTSAKPLVHTLAGQPVIEVPQTPLDGWGAIYKRGFDIIVSLILIIITLPLQIITAIAIFVESPGNVFFTHQRVGQEGRAYRHIKFRSMVKNAHKYRFDPEFIKQHGNERDGTPLFKLSHDPRITRVGRLIRKLSLDELPEFYLVLFGKMSLIGPRPHLPGEVAQYKDNQKRVLTIKPGITGMAQVGGRADLDFDDEVRLDLHYIENWSPLLDLIILAKTPLVVLFGRGAY
jgi:exopolysaccharide biosynthesis polyprenyl glycosylphosphotransferase